MDRPCSDVLRTSPLRRVELEVSFDVEGEWHDGTATDVRPPTQPAEAESNYGPPRCQSANMSNDLGRKGSVAHEVLPMGLLQAPCDIEPTEALVRTLIYETVR